MEAALAQLSMHHAELALRMVVGALLGGVRGVGSGRVVTFSAAFHADGTRVRPPIMFASEQIQRVPSLNFDIELPLVARAIPEAAPTC